MALLDNFLKRLTEFFGAKKPKRKKRKTRPVKRPVRKKKTKSAAKTRRSRKRPAARPRQSPKKRPTLKRKPKQKRNLRRKKKSPAKPRKSSKPQSRPTAGLWIGVVTHYFSKISVIVIKMRGPLRVGDRIRIDGHTSHFVQKVQSLQIESKDVASAKKGQLVGLKVKKIARAGDKVYKLK